MLFQPGKDDNFWAWGVETYIHFKHAPHIIFDIHLIENHYSRGSQQLCGFPLSKWTLCWLFSVWVPTLIHYPFSAMICVLGDHLYGLPSQLVLGWVQPMGGTHRKLEGRRKDKLRFFSPVSSLFGTASLHDLSSCWVPPVASWSQFILACENW